MTENFFSNKVLQRKIPIHQVLTDLSQSFWSVLSIPAFSEQNQTFSNCAWRFSSKPLKLKGEVALQNGLIQQTKDKR